jgi:hypothetical protein
MQEEFDRLVSKAREDAELVAQVSKAERDEALKVQKSVSGLISYLPHPFFRLPYPPFRVPSVHLFLFLVLLFLKFFPP